MCMAKVGATTLKQLREKRVFQVKPLNRILKTPCNKKKKKQKNPSKKKEKANRNSPHLVLGKSETGGEGEASAP